MKWFKKLVFIWTLLNILFILYFLGAHVISGLSLIGMESKEMIAFIFFPIGVFTGLLASLKEPFYGGIIIVISLAAFYTCMPNTVLNIWINLLALPGFLSLIIGIKERS
ncbi:MAG: hypothetical protein R2799_04285 [Crocinitomicaceae bacterium]